MTSKKDAAVLEPPQQDVETQPTTKRDTKAAKPRPKRQPRYHVILWDDDDHSYEYVVRMMRKVFGFELEKGFEIACEVDTRGKAICLTTTLEHAELKRDQIHGFGRDFLIARCEGSMSATIEPEPS